MLILGLAALATVVGGTVPSCGYWSFSLLISDRSKAIGYSSSRWKTETPSSDTLNLWANPQERAEWAQALRLTEGRKPVLLQCPRAVRY